MTWNPRPPAGPPSAWIEIATSARARLPIAARVVVGICERDGGATSCSAYQRARGEVVLLGENDNWGAECQNALALVTEFKRNGFRNKRSNVPSASGAEPTAREWALARRVVATANSDGTAEMLFELLLLEYGSLDHDCRVFRASDDGMNVLALWFGADWAQRFYGAANDWGAGGGFSLDWPRSLDHAAEPRYEPASDSPVFACHFRVEDGVLVLDR